MSRRVLLCLLCALALPARAHAADEVHWTFTGPTSVTFDWRGSETTVRYGLTSAYGSTATAVTPSPVPPSSSGPFWEARIGGLLYLTIIVAGAFGEVFVRGPRVVSGDPAATALL